MKKFYTQYESKWRASNDSCLILGQDGAAGAKEIKNAVILPVRKTRDVSVITHYYEGGVCTESFEFIAGLKRRYQNHKTPMNLECINAYTPQEPIVEENETVIFGGVLINHFGHAILDSLSRMWWIIQHPEVQNKIVVLMPELNATKIYSTFWTLAGIPEERIKIVTRPTKFSKVIIPDEAMFAWAGKAYAEWPLFFWKMRENVQSMDLPKHGKKLYLTRTGLKNSFEVNEKYFESFYIKRGFEVVSPEQLSLAEQIHMIYHADEIVCTIGTLSHMLLFMRQDAKACVFLRQPDLVITPQLIIDKVCGLNVTYVEATGNFLPTDHVTGIPLYKPTVYFAEYLADFGIKYTETELQCDERMLAYEFLKAWSANYAIPWQFRGIKKLSIADVVYTLNKELNGKELDAKILSELRAMANEMSQKREADNKQKVENEYRLKYETDVKKLETEYKQRYEEAHKELTTEKDRILDAEQAKRTVEYQQYCEWARATFEMAYEKLEALYLQREQEAQQRYAVENDRLSKAAQKLEKELADIRKSRSYKLGKAITAVPKKILGFISKKK